LAKVDAKKKIAKAVDQVAISKKQAVPEEEIARIQQHAMKEIAEAIAMVEVTKARATKAILHATGEAEMKKVSPVQTFVDEEAAVTIAKNRSAVKIAKAVSAVEVAKAASRVELIRSLDPQELRTLVQENEALSLDQVKAKAQAAISTALSKVELPLRWRKLLQQYRSSLKRSQLGYRHPPILNSFFILSRCNY